MAEYSVKFKELSNQAAALESVGKALAGYEASLRSIAGSMDIEDSGMSAIRSAVSSCAKKVSATAQKPVAASRILIEASETYSLAEEEVYVAFGGVIEKPKTTSTAKTGAIPSKGKKTNAKWWSSFKKAITGTVDKISNFTKETVKTVGKAVKTVGTEVSRLIYENRETIWQTVKTTAKFVGATVLVTVSAASIMLGNPAGVMGVIYGVNSLASVGSDFWNISQGQNKKVGTFDLLKSGAKKAGETLGENLGAGIGYIIGGEDGAIAGEKIGRSVGGTVGTVTYELGEIVTTVAVGNTVISNSNTTFKKMKDVLNLKNSAKAYYYTEKAVDWIDDPVKQITKELTPAGKTAKEEIVKKASDKVKSFIIKKAIPKPVHQL
jgi:gas vesicle protein